MDKTLGLSRSEAERRGEGAARAARGEERGDATRVVVALPWGDIQINE